MPNRNDKLQELLQIEATIFDKLNAVIADISMEDSDVDALSLRYEICVKAILDYPAVTVQDATQKCDFIFTMIGRSYNEGELLESMKMSLMTDFKRLTDNQ